jgi:multidrug efflux pump subunit AcrA (membrane-fusion protein)
LFIALALALCLPSWLASAQPSFPISRLGPEDYQTFQADWLTARLQLAASRSALEQALNENAIIKDNLQKAEENAKRWEQSAMQQSEDSKKRYEVALQEVATLRQHLSESESLVAELQTSLESAEEKYDQSLQQAEARAKALERENCLLKIGCGLLAAGAVGLGIWAISR